MKATERITTVKMATGRITASRGRLGFMVATMLGSGMGKITSGSYWNGINIPAVLNSMSAINGFAPGQDRIVVL